MNEIKIFVILVNIFAVFGMNGCIHQAPAFSLTVLEEKILDSIPSGSGIFVKDDTAYIIGDDATGLYKVDLKNYHQEKMAVIGLEYSQYREAKDVKHDFESATPINWNGDDYLLSFGSGSKRNWRDSILVIRLSNPADSKIISLQHFYEKAQLLTQCDAKEWNIEGATVAGDLLILFNRGKNTIIKFSLNDFMLFLTDANTTFPTIEYHAIKLPSIENHEARLSGGCTLDDDLLLFCASVEDTPDWIKDGPVLGSFIGIYSLRESKVVTSCLLQKETGVPLKEKLESLDILQKDSNQNFILLAIGDKDDGTTNLFRIKMNAIGNK